MRLINDLSGTFTCFKVKSHKKISMPINQFLFPSKNLPKLSRDLRWREKTLAHELKLRFPMPIEEKTKKLK